MKRTSLFFKVGIFLIAYLLFFTFYGFDLDYTTVLEKYNSNINVEEESKMIELVSSVNNIKSNSVINTPVSAETEKIIKMSESEIWSLMTEGKYKSISEAQSMSQAEADSLVVEIKVPVWKWKDKSKTDKEESTVSFKVNKYLAQFWTDFFTELKALPEQYVIESMGSTYSYRRKLNGTGTNSLSAHSFGASVDINPVVNGMSSLSQSSALGVPSSYGLPWSTSTGLSSQLASTCCTGDNSWNKLAQKYNLDWGGNWSYKFLDPMHFSLVGDNNKDTRKFEMKYKSRRP